MANNITLKANETSNIRFMVITDAKEKWEYIDGKRSETRSSENSKPLFTVGAVAFMGDDSLGEVAIHTVHNLKASLSTFYTVKSGDVKVRPRDAFNLAITISNAEITKA